MNEPSRKTGERITAIRTLRNGRIAVLFGSKKLILTPNVFSEMPLYVGKEVTPLEMRSLESLTRNESLYAYGLYLAAKGSYSAHEVKARLLKKAGPLADPKEVLFRLRQAGFLDDEDYARQYRDEKTALLYGKARILEELRFKKGIPEAILTKLSFPEEKANAEKAVLSLERKYARLPLGAKRAKIAAALVRRGFAPSEAQEAVASLKGNPVAEKESLRLLCKKTVERYSRKYNGYDLKAHCYAYLMSKGYESSAIRALLEEYL